MSIRWVLLLLLALAAALSVLLGVWHTRLAARAAGNHGDERGRNCRRTILIVLLETIDWKKRHKTRLAVLDYKSQMLTFSLLLTQITYRSLVFLFLFQFSIFLADESWLHSLRLRLAALHAELGNCTELVDSELAQVRQTFLAQSWVLWKDILLFLLMFIIFFVRVYVYVCLHRL